MIGYMNFFMLCCNCLPPSVTDPKTGGLGVVLSNFCNEVNKGVSNKKKG
jgi:hypothetical protein